MLECEIFCMPTAHTTCGRLRLGSYLVRVVAEILIFEGKSTKNLGNKLGCHLKIYFKKQSCRNKRILH